VICGNIKEIEEQKRNCWMKGRSRQSKRHPRLYNDNVVTGTRMWMRVRVKPICLRN